MKRVHIVPTLIDAQLAADTLASLGIPNHIFNGNAAGALGEVPFINAQPEIWVEDDSQAERAREILLRVAATATETEKPCPHCGEFNPAHFLSCWQCGSTLPA
ncbi:MAG: DUF2007 domain-containing protein [Pseudomonadota bacterium]